MVIVVRENNFAVAELVYFVTCKGQVRRTCGLPASWVGNGIVPWFIVHYQLLVDSQTFHFSFVVQIIISPAYFKLLSGESQCTFSVHMYSTEFG